MPVSSVCLWSSIIYLLLLLCETRLTKNTEKVCMGYWGKLTSTLPTLLSICQRGPLVSGSHWMFIHQLCPHASRILFSIEKSLLIMNSRLFHTMQEKHDKPSHSFGHKHILRHDFYDSAHTESKPLSTCRTTTRTGLPAITPQCFMVQFYL